jgi:hypothetical protein
MSNLLQLIIKHQVNLQNNLLINKNTLFHLIYHRTVSSHYHKIRIIYTIRSATFKPKHSIPMLKNNKNSSRSTWIAISQDSTSTN